MTKGRQLIADAIDNLDCTEQERSDIREHMRDSVDLMQVSSYAREIAESYLQMIRDITAEEAAQPKWTRLHHSSEGCKASCCTNLAMWEIQIEAVPGIWFTIKACSKHAGKETSEQ